jgi:hypothetical protein
VRARQPRVDGKSVFALTGRGIGKHLVVNAESGRLGDTDFSATDAAAHICPVGVILPKGRLRGAHRRAHLRRGHDPQQDPEGVVMSSPARKLRVATASLAGCFGCHMSFLDIDEHLFELVELIEFDRSPSPTSRTSAPATSASSKAACAMPRTCTCCASSAATARP